MLGGLVEDEEEDGRDDLAGHVIMVDIHFQLGILLCDFVDEEHEDEQEVHEHHKRVDVLILHYEPH